MMLFPISSVCEFSCNMSAAYCTYSGHTSKDTHNTNTNKEKEQSFLKSVVKL